MTHIFISYKRENLSTVEAIVNELKRHHYVWFDQTGIPGGTEWEEHINTALDTAATLILMVTSDALASEWVQYEFHTALHKGVRVIPLMLEACELPDELRGLQALQLSDSLVFEKLMDALPDVSRIWGDYLVPKHELKPEYMIGELASAYPDGIHQIDDNLIGLPIHQTRYCKVYLIGKSDTTLAPQENYQLALQLTSRNFSLTASTDGAYPQDEFAWSIANHFLTSPSKDIRLFLVQGPLNQAYDNPNRLGFRLNVNRRSEWEDVIQAADYVRGIANGNMMQLFVNGPAIMTYQLGASNPGFSRYELYQLDYATQDYTCVLSG